MPPLLKSYTKEQIEAEKEMDETIKRMIAEGASMLDILEAI